jgi:hypothetical protein
VNIPIWIWYIVGAAIIAIVTLYVAGAIFGFRRFKRMESDFNDQRERVRRNLRRP